MVDLLIRKVPPGLKRRVKDSARNSGRSLSEELKCLIERGLTAPPPPLKMGDFLYSLVEDRDRGDDLVFEYRGDFPKPPDFE